METSEQEKIGWTVSRFEVNGACGTGYTDVRVRGACDPTAMTSIGHALSGPCLDEKLATIAGTGLSRGWVWVWCGSRFSFLPASGGEATYKWLRKRTMMSRQSKDPVQKCHSDPGAASTGGTPCSPGKRISRRLVPGIPSSSNTRKCVLTLDGYSYVIGEYWITIRLELLSFWCAGLKIDRRRERKKRIRLSYVPDY